MRAGGALLALLVVLAGCASPAPTDLIGTDAPATADGTTTPTAAGTATPTATVEGATSGSSSPSPSPSDSASPSQSNSPSSSRTDTPRPPTPTPRTEGKVAVSGYPLDVDEESLYRTVVEMHGLAYETAPAVELQVKERAAPSRTDSVWETSAFMELWGFDASEMRRTSIAGLAVGTRVFLYVEPVQTKDGRRSVLAHEYTHVLQHHTDAFRQVKSGVRAGDGNTRRVYLAVTEGSATYVERRYADVHLNVSRERRSWAGFTRNRSRFGTYVVAPYFFGPRYVGQRIDSVEELSAVYERPPRTTEQVIHGYDPDEEPARPLTIRTEESASTGWHLDDERVRGELFVRLALAGELERERAAAAAAGWGSDRVLSYATTGSDERAHAWVLRWDDTSEADEFAAAIGDYLDARADRASDRWVDGETVFDLRWAGEETVVVLAGPDRFVDDVTVTGSNDAVSVSVDE